MTGTQVASRPPTPPPSEPLKGPTHPRRRLVALVAAAALAAAGIGIGLGVSLGSSSGTATSSDPAYAYYQSVMGRYPASMMGGSMMGSYGYGWMTGGADTPGWMMGGTLPSQMMGGATDPGQVMGRLWADAPGPRVSPADVTRLGNETPAGASVDQAANSITFSGGDVHLVILASPPGGPDETFRVAGLTNPTIGVPAGARVSMEIINADPDTAHGVVVTASAATSSWMPMMSAAPAFPGSALWFLGNPTSAGMHAGTLTFTASTAGTYHYLCPVPGHAQKGMVGTFLVR